MLLNGLRMFSAKCFRLFLTVFWQIIIWPVRLAALTFEYLSDDCRPLNSNTELLNFHRFPARWINLVEPLAQRCKPRSLRDQFENFNSKNVDNLNENLRSEVLVCHDLAGNYRDDRFINGTAKWDDYRFYHWSGIDYFCYFSHKYITIPTLPWINAAHRNGVKVLGTVICESGNGKRLLEDILKSEDHMRSIADSLTLIAKYCKFEGWLLNIECTLPEAKIPLLRDFVAYLHERIRINVPQGVVFWYDSIINTGTLTWQNELNKKNKLFFDVSDGILLNYNWSDWNLMHSADILNRDPEDMRRVFVGIDVFGRGQVAKFQTNETLAKIRKYNFSVGIFAPGWTFEATREFGVNISTPAGNDVCNTHFIERNDRFWSMLWQYLNTFGPVQLPFYTTFCIGSGKQKFHDGIVHSNSSWFNLSDQSWQPSVPVGSIKRHFTDSFTGGSSLWIAPLNDEKRLFICDFSCDQGLILGYVCKKEVKNDIDVLLAIENLDQKGRVCKVICGGEGGKDVQLGEQRISQLKDGELQKVLIHLSQKQEKVLPSFGSINGWETRYYFLRFNNTLNARVTDIGVRSIYDERSDVLNGVLLGALHVHAGSNSLAQMDDIYEISSWDFA